MGNGNIYRKKHFNYIVKKENGIDIIVDFNNKIINHDEWEELKEELDDFYYRTSQSEIDIYNK